MNIKNMQDIRKMDNDMIDEQIRKIKRTLFDFRMKQATKQSFKPHLIRIYKKQLAQMMTAKHEQINSI
uniref:Large ribosomal subunit protein uL29c n=1 Tax=Hommersandiophycus borowitzkae TaxID=268573 RepID=A0A1G4NU70_9FLOR|nr:Ribosomal protein L29 [Hommersandiophycus borowitzkae]SCW22210.1 Ribosomal protein L29 [Hommersandiophycus borowitzkae]